MGRLTHGPYGRGDYGVGLYGSDEIAPYPNGPVRARTQLLLGADWVDITPDVLFRDEVEISHGRADEGQTVDRAQCSFSLNNRDGRYSPRNPYGPNYGLLGRSTQCRISVNHGSTRLAGQNGAAVSYTLDSAQQDVTGDIDVRVDASLPSWRYGATATLLEKWGGAGHRSYRFLLNSDGTVSLVWSADGTASLTATSTVAVPYPLVGRKALRATLDVDNGAAGNTVTFYAAPTLAGDWVPLGDPVTQASTTSIFASDAAVATYVITPEDTVYAVQVRAGIDGTVVAYPDFTDQTDSATSFTDAAGADWVAAAATITNQRYLVWGEISSLPTKWDSTGTDVWVPVEVNGVLQRIGADDTPLGSAMFRAITALDPAPKAYWSLEDGELSTSFASGINGGTPMFYSGSPTLGGSTTEFRCSSPLPVLAGAALAGAVPTYTATGELQVRMLLTLPAAGSVAGELLSFYTTGTAATWAVTYAAGSANLALTARDSTGTAILSTGAIGFDIDGLNVRLSVELVQDGADIDWAITTLGTGDDPGGTFTGTLAGYTVGACTSVAVNRLGQQTDNAAGHVSVHAEVTSIFDLAEELNAFVGEDAIDRLLRLCAEEGVAIDTYGGTVAGSAMGPQLPGKLLDLLHECERTDNGLLYESRHSFGLLYRPRETLYNRTPHVTVDYHSGMLAGLDPVEDDQLVANSVKVSRVGGSYAVADQTTGPLSTAAPPDGVNRRPVEVSINTADDTVLVDHATYRLRFGTVDEARVPAVSFDFGNPGLLADPDLAGDLLDLVEGSRFDITNPPAWLPPDTLTLAVQGFKITLSNFRLVLQLNCTPDSPYQVMVIGPDAMVPAERASRYTTAGAALVAAANDGDTTLLVASPHALWTHDDGDYDIVVSGVRLTVTGVSGSSSPQTFTISAAPKYLPDGSAVELYFPAYIAL